jgi:hypothetical protein
MRRVLFGFGLVASLSGLFLLGLEVWKGGAHPTHLYVMGGVAAFGMIVAALMADPKTVISVLDRAITLRRGKE